MNKAWCFSRILFKYQWAMGLIQGLTGTEDFIKIRKKLGDEKFEMAVQMYNYFEDLLERGMNETDESKSGTDEQTTQVISQLQQEVYELKTRLVNLEKMTGFNPDIAI